MGYSGNWEIDYQVVSVVLALGCLALLMWALQLRHVNMLLKAELNELDRQLQQAIQRLLQYETEPTSKIFTKSVDLLAAAGVPGLILLGAMAVSGFSGAAAITVALASLGGPAGMLGGIGVLVSIGIVIAKYGIVEVSRAVVRKLLAARPKEKILQEIDALPRAIPQKFRVKAKSLLES